MQKLIKDGCLIDDNWQVLEKDTELAPAQIESLSGAIIPLSQWQLHKQQLLQLPKNETGKLEVGVWIDSDESVDCLQEHCNALSVIAINFPVFSDGRGYSYARTLRNQLGYSGELRAIGDVLKDQLHFYARCGFDSFALREDVDAETAIAGLKDFSVHYQAAEDNPTPIFRRR